MASDVGKVVGTLVGEVVTVMVGELVVEVVLDKLGWRVMGE